jgi:putative peptide zinc metalloprotease protein
VTTTPQEEQTRVLRPEPDSAPLHDDAPPRLAEGIDLIGEYEDSGFKEAPYIARRADGQVIQMPELLFNVAEAVDGSRSYDEVAEAVSEKIKRGVDADMIRQLLDEQLRPLGVVAPADGTPQPELQKADPLLALKLRAGVVPERLVNAITVVFRPLFWPPVVLAVLAGLAAADYWLFFRHGVAQSLRQSLYDPAFILILLGLVVLSAAFHETGHATACRYGGARPGKMGVGLYIVWPAFYTDVTDAYRLGKGGRLRTDLGGVYFNVIFILGTLGAYFLTGFEPLLLVIPLQHIEIVHQFLPFLRLDGYYIVSDLTGVPDMFARIKPTLASVFLPWRQTPEEVTVLKPWVRAATTIYVLTIVPLLGFFIALMVINLPRIVTTAYDSFILQWDKLGHESALHVAVSVLQMVVLTLPVLGIVYTFWMLGRKALTGGWHVTAGRPVARAAFVTATVALLAGVGWIWAPAAVYRPIQPGERGTVVGGLDQLAAVQTGRPALTPAREQQLKGAPLKSKSAKPAAPSAPAAPATTLPNKRYGSTTTTTPTDTTDTTTMPAATTSTPTTTTQTTPTTDTTTTATVTTTPTTTTTPTP